MIYSETFIHLIPFDERAFAVNGMNEDDLDDDDLEEEESDDDTDETLLDDEDIEGFDGDSGE